VWENKGYFLSHPGKRIDKNYYFVGYNHLYPFEQKNKTGICKNAGLLFLQERVAQTKKKQAIKSFNMIQTTGIKFIIL